MAGPTPRTRCSPSNDPNGPRATRSSTMRRARAGPMRGRRSNSAAEADSTSIGGTGSDGVPPRTRRRPVGSGADVAWVPARSDARCAPRSDARSAARASGAMAPIGVVSDRGAPWIAPWSVPWRAPSRAPSRAPASPARPVRRREVESALPFLLRPRDARPAPSRAARSALASCASSPPRSAALACSEDDPSRTNRPPTPRTTMRARRSGARCVGEGMGAMCHARPAPPHHFTASPTRITRRRLAPIA